MNTVHLPFLGVGVVAPESAPPWTPDEGPPMLVDNELLCQQWQRQLPQGRPQMVIDARLMLYAAWVASDIITHTPDEVYHHRKSTGEGPNDVARRMGIWLPSYYKNGPDANQIESLAFNVKRAEMCIQKLLTSPGHRAHLLAEEPMWAEQVRIGAAYAVNFDRQGDQWWTGFCAVSVPVQPEG